MALTDMKIRALRPETKTKKYSDGGGLHLKVDPTGSTLWRCSYRFNGKQKTLAFGRYPEVSLAQARKKRDDAKRLLANGIDPSLEIKKLKLRRKAEIAHTFEALARELLNKRAKEGLSDVTLRKKEWLLEMATKSFGSYPIIDVKTADILSVIREIEDRGNYETAKRLRTSIGEVFRYAIAIGACEYDPTYALRGALISHKIRHRSALIEEADFKALVRDVWSYHGSVYTSVGLKLMVLLYPRPGELRHMEWAEIDFDKKIWTLPAEKTKMRSAHKKPLPEMAVSMIKSLSARNLDGYVLPATTSLHRPISENTFNQALRRLGYTSAQATAHGFRASASSLLNESGLWSPDAIEAELAHVGSDQVRRAYHRSRYWDERVSMANWWATKVQSWLTDP